MKRRNVKIILRTTVLLFSIMGLVRCNSAVDKTNSSYSCCNPIFTFDQSCENIWRMDDENFAYIYHQTKECMAPCNTIEDDRISLDSCLNVTVTTVCTTTMGTAKETRHTYLGHECPQPLLGRMSPAQGSSGLLLPAVIWMASVLK